MTGLIFFFVLSILFSFLCSIWEAVLLSITPAFVSIKEQEKHPQAPALARMKEDIDKPLSAILTLNTIAHTVGAIGVGVQAGKIFGTRELALGPIHLSYESIVAALMTLAILILSEIIPKTIGANYWKKLWGITVKSLKFLVTVLRPFVWVSQKITRVLSGGEKSKSVLSRADVAAIATVGERKGVLDQKESRIINNLLYLNELTVKDIMTPRTVLVAAEANTTLLAFHQAHPKLRFSRFPVYEEKMDMVTGFVLKDEVLERIIAGEEATTLKEITRPVEFLSETMTLAKFLDLHVQNKRNHLKMVVDEYGAVIGLVTLEDVFETILGLEIMDERDNIEDMQHYARQQWEKRAKERGLLE